MQELLKLESINFRYEDKFTALKAATATFYKGERIAILGNNGAGKSTFFLCCNGVLRPQSGKIYLKGQEINYSKKSLLSLRQAVGLVFQEPDSQIIAGTVENEVSFGPMNLRLPQNEVDARVTGALKRMNIEGYRNHAPQYLSGGEKKRVSIADILAMSPDMMLFDEPTSSLDPFNAEVLENTLDELSRSGITVVVSTHDVDFAFRFAHRAIVFNKGEIIADAKIDEVFKSENLLSKAGLKKPPLYEVAEIIEGYFPEIEKEKKPRTVDELRQILNKIDTGRRT